MRRRPLVIALVVAVAAAGVVLAILLGGDENGEERAATRQTAPAGTTEASPERTTTETAPRPPPRRNPRDTRAVEAAVTTLVEATEQGDGPRACGVIAGARGDDLEACAAARGIDLRTLPTSDEFSIDRVGLGERRARVRLSNGTTVLLERLDRAWKVARVRSAAF